VFYMFVILFAVIGAMRGWAQELLVSFSVILAFFMITVLEQLTPYVKDLIVQQSTTQFWFRTLFLIILVYFGYQTPTKLSRFAGAVRKDRISDSFLGIFLGAINGFLIIGTLWYYMDYAGYPFKYFLSPGTITDPAINPLSEAAISLVAKLPAAWLGAPPGIYIAVGLAFLFVLVVFI
jgi:hypothetical protein